MSWSLLRVITLVVGILSLLAPSAHAARKQASAVHNLNLESVNNAEWRGGNISTPLLVKLQILLDRAHASPGEIDASRGENTRKAVAAYREMRGLGRGDQIDQKLWSALVEADQRPALTTYTIAEKDTAGPFLDKIPDDYREKASLKRLSYTSVQELLAEKFHMSEKLLRELNPNARFEEPGTEIIVANVQREELPRKITRVEVDAARQRVIAYDKSDAIVAVYPATVGSGERPSPSGDFKVPAFPRTRAITMTPR
jgi:peptidoglycan hydrolase-like protein with peptidoglycan-binding domain